MNIYLRNMVIGGLGIFLSGCGQQALNIAPASSKQVIEDITERVVLPALEQLSVSTKGLLLSAQELCKQPSSERLTETKSAWVNANLAWRKVRPFLFGPADKLRIRRQLDDWPTHALVLNALLKEQAEASLFGDKSVRGFAAVEMMLYGDQTYPAVSGQWQSDTNCLHIQDVAKEIYQLSTQLHENWLQAYGETFTHMQSQEALSLLFAEMLNTTDALLWQRLGIPANFFRGAVKTEQLEAWRSSQSLQGIIASLNTISIMLTDEAGKSGILSLLIKDHPDQAAKLFSVSSDTLTAAKAIGSPLKIALYQDQDAVEILFDDIQSLKNEILSSAEKLALNVQFEEDGD